MQFVIDELTTRAFQIKSWGKFLIWALLGVLYMVAGFVTFEDPLLAAVVLTLMLGASLVASGIIRVIIGYEARNTVDMGSVIRRNNSAAWPIDPGTLAHQQRLHSWPVPGHRSYHGGNGLDLAWVRSAPGSGCATDAISKLTSALPRARS